MSVLMVMMSGWSRRLPRPSWGPQKFHRALSLEYPEPQLCWVLFRVLGTLKPKHPNSKHCKPYEHTVYRDNKAILQLLIQAPPPFHASAWKQSESFVLD